MFDDDGWCRSCGIPTREQSGSLVLQTKGMSKAEGAWVPYWRYDAICLSEELASEVADRFVVELREVEWRGRGAPRPASQIVAACGSERWFDETAQTNASDCVHDASFGSRSDALGEVDDAVPRPNARNPKPYAFAGAVGRLPC